MNLGGPGQNMPQPQNTTGGMLGRLANILGRNQNLAANYALNVARDTHKSSLKKDEITHQGKVKVDTEKQLGEVRMDQGHEGLVKRYQTAFEEHEPGTPEYEAATPHPVTGKRYMHTELADQAIKGGLSVDAKGQVNVGPVSAINLSETVNKRNETKPPAEENMGKPGTKADVKSALTLNNTPIKYPFNSTVGESGNYSPKTFNEDSTPVFSEEDAEQVSKKD